MTLVGIACCMPIADDGNSSL